MTQEMLLAANSGVIRLLVNSISGEDNSEMDSETAPLSMLEP